MDDDDPRPTPTAQRGLPLEGEGMRDLIVAFREKFESHATMVDDRLASIVGGMKTVEARTQVLESDVRQLRADVVTVKSVAEAARQRADTAHTLSEVSVQAAQRLSFDSDGAREALTSALTETRGKLETATAQLGELRKTDEELKAMVEQAAKDSAGAAIREVVGKNPKLVAGIGALLIVAAQVMTQRFLMPPAAPNQGALPGPTPVVEVTK